MPPVSATTRMTSPRKRGPHGKPPSAGTPVGPTSSQSSGSPRYERSEEPISVHAGDGRSPCRPLACENGEAPPGQHNRSNGGIVADDSSDTMIALITGGNKG